MFPQFKKKYIYKNLLQKKLFIHVNFLTIISRHLLSFFAPQQPQNPSRTIIIPVQMKNMSTLMTFTAYIENTPSRFEPSTSPVKRVQNPAAIKPPPPA